MFKVIDFYENPFGETVYVTDSIDDAMDFIEEYNADTDGECTMRIKIEGQDMLIDPATLAIS